jgi:hypothetical protein
MGVEPVGEDWVAVSDPMNNADKTPPMADWLFVVGA